MELKFPRNFYIFDFDFSKDSFNDNINILITILKENIVEMIHLKCFHQCNFDEKTWKLFTEVLKDNNSLYYLKIQGVYNDNSCFSKFGVDLLFDAIEKNNSIYHLYFLNCNFGNEDAKKLFESLKENKKIKHLVLDGNNIEKYGIISLSNLLKKNRNIEELFLYNNKIQDDELEELSNSLKSNNVIKYIDLSNNQISDKGAKFFFETMKENDLLEISLYDNNKISKNMEKMLNEMKKLHRMFNELKDYSKFKYYDYNNVSEIMTNEIISFFKTIIYNEIIIGNEESTSYKYISEILKNYENIYKINPLDEKLNEKTRHFFDIVVTNRSVNSFYSFFHDGIFLKD